MMDQSSELIVDVSSHFIENTFFSLGLTLVSSLRYYNHRNPLKMFDPFNKKILFFMVCQKLIRIIICKKDDLQIFTLFKECLKTIIIPCLSFLFVDK